MNLISISSEDKSEEIAKNLHGKKFIAISISDSGGSQYHLNRMNDEEIVYHCSLMINKILSENVITEKVD